VGGVKINVDNATNNMDTVHAVSSLEEWMTRKHAVPAHPYHHGDLRHALLEAALHLVKEGQDWTFSLREVARRAGVSHNAPYNHFPEKRDLLEAVAAAGFEELRQRLQASIAGIENPTKALIKSGVAYLGFGVENPARYRLMFGAALPLSKSESALTAAAAGAKAVLADLIYRGAEARVFNVSSRKKDDLQIAVLTAWSTIHGLTMVAIDRAYEIGNGEVLDVSTLAEKVARLLCAGLVRK
jgi:AcrR family transcriptional regulator